MKHDGGAMTCVTQVRETLRQILEEEANTLAKETGFMQRERIMTGADFAQTLIFGWLAEPAISLDGLTQVAGRRFCNGSWNVSPRCVCVQKQPLWRC
jgi:hypothetical protein